MTENLNLLSPINFQLKIAITPNVNYKVQGISLPGLTLGTATIKTPFVPIHEPGNLSYDTFSVTFKVAEDMRDYLEIFNWMVSLGHPDTLAQYSNIKSDASIFVLNSSKSSNMHYKFTDAFPIGLTRINLDSTMTDIQYVEATATFQFNRFYINPADC